MRVPFIVGGQSVSLVTDHFGGIGNRIIPMGCILSLAAELNYSPIVFWPASKVVGGATFGDLFESTNLPFELVGGCEAQIMSIALFDSHRARKHALSPAKERSLILLRRLISLQYDKTLSHKSCLAIRDQAATDLRSFHKIGLFVYGPARYGYDISWLKPIPQIASRVTELKQQFAPNTVGVHLRGTDLKNNPPVNKIIARMRAEIDLDPEVKFFLASDGDRRGEAITTLFKDRLIESQKSTERVPILVRQGPAGTKQMKNTERGTILGQQDAIVDLFGLAATSRIIGSGYSSFGRLAALIGNKPLLRIKPTKL